MESVHDMSGCRDSQRVKYTAGSFVGKALTWWNSEIRTQGREATVGMSWEDFRTLTREEFFPSNEMQKLVPDLVTPEGKKIERYVYGLAPQIRGMVAATKPKTIQKVVQLAGTLTDKALRNETIKKNPEKRGNVGEPSKDRNGREDNKRTRTGNAFVTTANPVRGCYTGMTPKCTACGYHHLPETPCRSYFNCNRLGHFAKDCRVAPKNVNPINARNPVARTCFEYGSTDHIKGQGRGNQGNHARGRAFMLGGEKARQDPNIMTGTFTLNNHYAITLFDFGADYSFVSTTFIPLLDIESSDLGFSYEIEIASGQLVEIDKLSDHKSEIICHEKVVRIPLLDGKVLRVLGEKPKEKMRHVINGDGIHVDPSKIKAVKNGKAHKTPYEVRSFLRLIGYHHRFIEYFSKIAKLLTVLTYKSKTFDWGEEQECAFQTLKDKLCNAYVLALPNGLEDFVVYCDASLA
ncbi:putative reverse transcriptase domain-containing protein [Tanacetum coccineum]